MTRPTPCILALTACLAGPTPLFSTQHPSPSISVSRVDFACAPRLVTGPRDTPLQVTGTADGVPKTYLGPSDTLVINGGHDRGLALNQEFFVRRVAAPGAYSRGLPPILHTAAWVRIIGVGPDSAMAAVVQVCGEIRLGDALEPAVWPPAVVPTPAGLPDYDRAGVVLLGLDGRSFIAPHEHFVFSLGAISEIVPGQRLALFRPTGDGAHAVITVGEAVAISVDVDTDSATARLLTATDVIEAGVRVAPHR